ncbi:B-cell receptor CD22-like [Eleutherodactylus coqui]|uniref:B-cell receptor CD22-like n=1 Tax=Eleutherodactylus coqui TaxID=57060 RepID=UPI0034617BFA
MKNIQVQGTWTFVFLMLLFKGVYNRGDQVKLGSNVIAWKGSCVILPCEINSSEDIHNYTWYHNSVYHEEESNYKGAIVYQSKGNMEIDSSFKDRVEYRGKNNKDCTILISDLQSEHAGRYQIRLMGKKKGKNNDWKWMSTNMSLTVSDIGPDLKLDASSEMEENSSVTFTCSIDYSCPSNDLSLTWLQDVNGRVTTAIKNDTHKISITTTLTFVPTWKDNKKNISCLLYRMNEMEGNESIQLNVKHKPQNVTIIAKSPIIRLLEGQNVTLECSVESSNPPNPNIIWYKNGQKLDSEAYKKTVDESGRYQCEAKNSMGTSKSETVEISVLHPPKHITIQKPQGNIIEGFPVTLNCSTVANPPVSRYIWYKNKMLFSNSTDSRYNFSKITENDSGFYECEASNSQGSNTSSRMYLDVKYIGPDLKLDASSEMEENSRVTFTCSIDYYCPVNDLSLTWLQDVNGTVTTNKKNDTHKISLTTTLTFVPTWKDNKKNISCLLYRKNEMKGCESIQLNVKHVPQNVQIMANIPTIRLLGGQHVTLECSVESSNPPNPNIIWYKNGQKLYPEAYKKTVDEPGQYHCEAKNSLGIRKSDTVEISVLHHIRTYLELTP